MEIKEVVSTGSASQRSEEASARRQKPVNSLSAGQVSPPAADSITMDSAGRHQPHSDIRARANQVITLANLAAEATAEIEKFVESIGGMAEQAGDPQISEHQRQVLEREANELVGEIKQRAQTSSGDGTRPLAGDEIRLEVEERLGKTLDFILPDGAIQGFGIGEISFSTKDLIINTIAKIESARDNIRQLREAVDRTVEGVKAGVQELEVALRNSEASDSSIQDVEQAARLAEETRVSIGENPRGAMNSVGALSAVMMDLLR